MSLEHYPKDQHIHDYICNLSLNEKIKYLYNSNKPLTNFLIKSNVDFHTTKLTDGENKK